MDSNNKELGMHSKHLTNKFEPIMKFFEIPSSGNLFSDIKQLATVQLTDSWLETRLYRIMFAAYDTDGNGTIDNEELGRLLHDIGITVGDEELANMSPEGVAEAMKQLDSNGDGVIEWKEFISWISEDDGINAKSNQN